MTILDLNCPNCRDRAEFVFAPSARVKTNADAEYFKKSKDFECVEWHGRSARFHRYALYYPHVSNNIENIGDLPSNYTAESWRPVQYRYVGTNQAVFESIDNQGVLICRSCPSTRRHRLEWPEEAFFQISYKGQTLWAYNQEFALTLLSYLESETRKKMTMSSPQFRGAYPFLYRVPTHFQTAKARTDVVKKLKLKLGLSATNHEDAKA